MKTILAVLAAVLAAAALAVSLLHAGPRGVAGSQGPAGRPGSTGRSAIVAHLGLCVNMGVQTGVVYVPAGAVDPLTTPVLTDGVPSCPAGMFVSIVPQP